MKFIIYFFLLFSFILSENHHPVILIHGFLGWGRNEMPGYYYWGGRTDLEAMLQESGHEVYSVSVGPISSNFDRAIETFYQIKGGQLDYGIIRLMITRGNLNISSGNYNTPSIIITIIMMKIYTIICW